jgi:hypothetical protein
MPKISKSKTLKYGLVDEDGDELEIEIEDDVFVLSVRHGGDDEGWKCCNVTLEQLEEMLAFARRHRP